MGAVKEEECSLFLSTCLQSGYAQQVHKSRYVPIRGSQGDAVGGVSNRAKECRFQTARATEEVVGRWLLSSDLALPPASCGHIRPQPCSPM